MDKKKQIDNREKIGKNNPPKHSQFKPGISPNPDGRPKGSKNRSTIFKKWMEIATKGKNPISGNDEEMSVEDKMVLKMISKVLVDGDVAAFKEAMDSMYGKHRERIDHTSDGEKMQPILNVPARMSFDEWEKKFGK